MARRNYTPNGTATEDSTRIGVIFAKEPPKHVVKVAGIANGRISIPPRADNHQEEASLRLPYDVQVLGFLPHMHLRGKAARYEAFTSDGTEVLLDIPRYDFNWQLLYRLAEPRTLKQGDTIRFTCWFDNSENNPANPDPSKTVRWGPQTDDEMHFGYVEYIVPGAKPGESTPSIRRARTGGRLRNVVGNGLFNGSTSTVTVSSRVTKSADNSRTTLMRRAPSSTDLIATAMENWTGPNSPGFDGSVDFTNDFDLQSQP